MKSTLGLITCLCLVTLPSPATADWLLRDDVQTFIDEMNQEHGLDREWLESVFAGVERRDGVLESIANPAESLPWHRYRPIFLTRERIEDGVAFWDEHEATLRRAEARFGVDAAMIVAIIGVETFYGRRQGEHPVLDSLVTLGFDYPPRSRFFRSELEHLLLLADEESLDLHGLRGSYAGAMGAGQFIASSYREYAVDFDGDGQRDLFDNWEDAIGSVANYFARHRWRHARPVVVPAVAPETHSLEGRDPGETTTGTLREAGFVFSDGIGDDERVRPIRLEGEEETEWWLGLHNFGVITRYNRSPLYAMAAWQLSEAIKRERAARD